MTTASRSRAQALELLQVGRYLLCGSDRAVVRYFAGCLFVAHGRRERYACEAARRSGMALPLRAIATRRWRRDGAALRVVAGGADRPAQEQLEAALGRAEQALTALAPELGDPLARAIVLLDHDAQPRGIARLFLFEQAATPGRVLELAWTKAGREALVAGRSSLHRLRRELEPDLRATVPEVTAELSRDELEATLSTVLAGSAIDVDLHTRLDPGRRRRLHLSGTLGWLARFHLATARTNVVEPEEMAVDVAAEDCAWWLPRLREICTERQLIGSAVHGDLWPRNVLLSESGAVGVVDWERSRDCGARHDDLYHFLLGYAASLHRDELDRESPVGFCQAFLEDGALSRDVARALACYADETLLPRVALRPLLHLHLHTCHGRHGGRLARLLSASERSIFDALEVSS